MSALDDHRDLTTVRSFSNALRPELEKPPERIAKLPVHRGYPVPWFVEWVV